MNTLGYKFNVVNNNVDTIGKLKYKKIEVSKGNNKLINIKSIKAMAESLQEEAISKNKNIQILIQGVGKLGSNIMLKSFNEDYDLMEQRYDEYFEGKIKDPSKFEEFYKVGITILYKN